MREMPSCHDVFVLLSEPEIPWSWTEIVLVFTHFVGRSEEEDEEDTSIYQAVLSPDCQDVRLKKGT
jgi:hypothetical protein